MKRLAILIMLTGLYSLCYCQKIDQEKERRIKNDFITKFAYFRLLTNPLLSDEDKHDKFGEIQHSNVYKDSVYYSSIILKISHWGSPIGGGQGYKVDMSAPPYLYLIEKGNGLTGIRYMLGDTISSSVYDSIFPYDNRFLACDMGGNEFSFHGGNVSFGNWRDIGFPHTVDYVGFVRGVQFGVDAVVYYNSEFSESIRKERPEYPDYEYTYAKRSLLSDWQLLIGAPKGKEDQLVEFIYYTRDPAKTGEPDSEHYYEMRYILPTNITSISERRFEKRRLTEEEEKNFLRRDTWNPLRYFIDRYRDPDINIDE
ncbi:hypothetical protein [Viscerimonas tarda]